MQNEMRDRLLELIQDASYNKGCVSWKELADYLIENGVIVPPCKVGQTLYVVFQMKDKRILPFINTYEATSIGIGKRKCVVYYEQDGYAKIFKQDDFGKTVFLTREEAEKALKVGADNATQ